MAGNIFVNHDEGRPRAFWRLLLQAVIFFGGTLIGSLVIGILVGVLIASSGADVTNPQTIQSMMDHPLAVMGGALASLGAVFLSYWIAARWLDKRPFSDFGLHINRSWWIDLAFGLFLGAFLMLIIFLVERAFGWLTVTGTMQTAQPGGSFWTGILTYVVLFLCVGIYEEMLSRGYQLRNLAEGLNLKPIGPRGALLLAYLISSSIFGLLHAGNPNATFTSTFNIIIAGLFLGLGYVLTGELAIPIGLHITWNFFQGNVFGFPVSGMNTAASFIGIEQLGSDLWTGGAFGPEAGLIGLLAMILGSILTVLWVRYRYGYAGLKDSLAVYTPAPNRFAKAGLPDQPESTIQNGG